MLLLEVLSESYIVVIRQWMKKWFAVFEIGQCWRKVEMKIYRQLLRCPSFGSNSYFQSSKCNVGQQHWGMCLWSLRGKEGGGSIFILCRSVTIWGIRPGSRSEGQGAEPETFRTVFRSCRGLVLFTPCWPGLGPSVPTGPTEARKWVYFRRPYA